MALRLPSLAFLFPILFLAGCESVYEKRDRLREASLDKEICVVHRIPLKPIRVFVQTEKGCYFYDPEVDKAYARFPNAYPLSCRRESSSSFARAEISFYCPKCEAAVVARVAPDAR